MTTIAGRWDRFERSSDAYLAVAGALMLLILVPILTADLGRFERVLSVILVGVATTIAMAASRANAWAVRLSWIAPIVILVTVLIPIESVVITRALAVALIFMLLSTPWVILRRIGSHEQITATTMWGAIAAYLALGMAFSMLYTVMFQQDPTAFTNVNDESLGNFNYFSFVTMTTLGYGDITPIGDVARAAVIFQTLLGQIYLVVVVARVVSMLGRPAKPNGPLVEGLDLDRSTGEEEYGEYRHGGPEDSGQ